MSIDARTLFELLPAIHRTRDAELARAAGLDRGPLEELMAVFAEQLGEAGESLDQLYDDLFIETCADWVIPYIGDLIGYESLHQTVPGLAGSRAEVAHTIALRRRKGTALVLEQLADDVTGWYAHAVEYFQHLGTTQYMNHIRAQNLQSPDLRDGGALEWIGTAFDTTNRTVDVRRIESGRGRYNIPNVGLHLWRILAYAHRESPAFRAGSRCYRASPLNFDQPLYNCPLAEDSITHLAQPDNVPWPLSRRRLSDYLERYYGESANATSPVDNPNPSLVLTVNGKVIERDAIRVCNLSDDGSAWAHTPPPDGIYAIDPALGRIALPNDEPDANDTDVRLTWYEGFSADIGGGEYDRSDSLPLPAGGTLPVRVPDDFPTLALALNHIAGDGVVEITDSSRYTGTLTIQVAANGAVEIRAANNRRPVLDLSGLKISGADNSACTLNGLLITGAPLVVPDAGGNTLGKLSLMHCTLVPGLSLNPDGSPVQPAAASLDLGISGLETTIDRCIVGGIRSHERASLNASDSLIDATARENVAFAAKDGEAPGATLSLSACTVIGKVHTAEVGLISNSILFAACVQNDSWGDVPVRAARKQKGCVRFSWVPFEAIVPKRHRCQPQSAADEQRIAPSFTSSRYGTPPYGQLSTSTPIEIRQGADDESEMGVFHFLFGPQRESNLRIRLSEYLRVSLHAGIFYES